LKYIILCNATFTLLLLAVFALAPVGSAAADSEPDPDIQTLAAWRAGSKVSLAAVEKYGLDRCFTAEKIDKTVQTRMRGRSFKRGCTVALSSLRYLRVLHYDSEGNIRLGEMVCSNVISGDLLSIFHKLYEARYPIERMVLIDDYGADDERSMAANNTTCFNFRLVAGSRRLSKHSLGRAVDINPLYNPHVRRKQGKVSLVAPQAGRRYANRVLGLPMMIDRDDLCYRLFIEHGFRWGGDWRSSKDYQHFEK